MARLWMSQYVQGVLDKHGVPAVIEAGGKHDKVRFELAGRSEMYVCAKSHSDPRAVLNATADIRRMLRAAGVAIIR